MMQPSLLQLEGYYVRDFSFSVRDDADDKIPIILPTVLHAHPREALTGYVQSVSSEFVFEINQTKPRRFRVLLEVGTKQVEGNFYPYTFSLKMVGYFRVAEEIPDETLTALISSSAPATLYTLAREYIAATTGRGPFPGAVLPLVSILPSEINVALFKGALPSTAASSSKQPKKKAAAKKRKAKRKPTVKK